MEGGRNMATIQIRRDTSANWTSVDPILAVGEFGLDTTNDILKLGDGVTLWSELSNMQGVIEDSLVVSVTGTVTGDFDTMNDALAYLSTMQPRYVLSGINVYINLLSGYVASEQLCIIGLDMAWITIVSEDAEVSVDSAAMVTVNSEWLPFISGDNANLPTIGTIFTSDGVTNTTNTSYCGIYGDGGHINIELACGFKGFGCNLRAEHACSVNAKEAVLSDGYVGAWVVGSMADFKGSDLSYNTYAGVISYDGASVRAKYCNATGSGAATATGTGDGDVSFGYAVSGGAFITRAGGTGYSSQSSQTPTANGILF